MKLIERTFLPVVLILVFLGLYWYGAVQQLTLVNTNMDASDQSAYMDYARSLYDSDYRFIGGRNRMPAYPFLQSLHLRPGMVDEQFFTQGKYFNAVLSVLLLAGIFLLVRPSFSGLQTLTFMLIIAFTVFIFKAGFFQTELLFYFETFVIFILLLKLFESPSMRLAVLAGILFGLAHLTKASVIPGLVLFAFFAGLKGLVRLYQAVRIGSSREGWRSTGRWLLVVPLVLVFFLITVFPYIQTSKRIFGQYFYNVNSTFYIWYDSWEEASRGTKAHGDRVGWPDMPAEEIPSLSKYLSEHTAGQIVARFTNGSAKILMAMRDNYGYGKYVAIYAGVLAAVAVWQRGQVWRALRRRPFQLLFVAAYFAAYFLLTAWYSPIGGANRLILALFLPFLYVANLALVGFDIQWSAVVAKRRIDFVDAVSLIVLIIVLFEIYFVLSSRIVTEYGGG